MAKRKSKKETSKKLAIFILVISIIDIQLCIFATYFNHEIPTEIAVALITEVVAVVITYCLKAYFGKKAEEKTRLEQNEQSYRH
jgi:hypothetical protein